MAVPAKPSRSAAPVVVRHDLGRSGFSWHMAAAAIASAVFHAVLLCILILIPAPSGAQPATESTVKDVLASAPEDGPFKDPFATSDVDPAGLEPDTDINYKTERKGPEGVPGMVNPNEQVGILNGDKNAAPVNMPQPGGYGGQGQGGALEGSMPGLSSAPGLVGGVPRGVALAGSFYGRSGATRDWHWRNGGGTKESEAAVARGLQWLVRHQSSDGRWALDGNFADRGNANDIAGTAFGLLPLLGSGHTHKPGPNNKYDKTMERGLLFLIRKQDKKSGDFGGGMYAHGLAAIAMCEAFGLSQDPALRRHAQMGVNFIVTAQAGDGSWGYNAGAAGDTSIVGWQVMALKSAQMAGLDVPQLTMDKAQKFLERVRGADYGYGYNKPGSSYTLTSVGLLLRQYLQGWGPQKLEMIKGVDNFLRPNPPGKHKNIYYYYYATQVMHHFGGSTWQEWNDKMRDELLKTQEKDGSWSSRGVAWGPSGGRLMVTSLSLLTLEVYYRHLPLYYREGGEKMTGGAAQK